MIVGADTGDDAAVLRIPGSDGLCAVLTADYITPIMDDAFKYGQVAAANSLSDVFAMGGEAVAALNLCCFPDEGIAAADLRAILEGAAAKAAECGCRIVGGHTVRDPELKFGLSVYGLVREPDVKRNSTARAGDALILTKPIGTGVTITGARKRVLPVERLLDAVRWMATLNDRGARLMVKHGASAATDVTGFGLAGHAGGMARHSGVGIVLSIRALPRYPWAEDLVRAGVCTGLTGPNRENVEGRVEVAAGVDPAASELIYDPQTSGGLLISIAKPRADALLDDLRSSGYTEAAVVGEVVAAPAGTIRIVA